MSTLTNKGRSHKSESNWKITDQTEFRKIQSRSSFLTPSKSEGDSETVITSLCSPANKSDHLKCHNKVIKQFASGDSSVSSPKRKYSKTVFTKKQKFEDMNETLQYAKVPFKISNYSMFNHSRGQVLIIHNSVCFHGLMSVTVLYGQVEILGYNLSKASGTKNVYSSRGTSLLYIKNINTSSNEKQFLNNLLPQDINDLPNEKISAQSSILLCTVLNDKAVFFVEKHISQQILPKFNNNLPRLIIEPPGIWNVIAVNKEWDNITSNIENNTKMLFCGGKGVGKSTLLRYCINKLLMRFPKVRILDLDPGQSEFTVPGSLSIVTITEPVFGSNFTHLKTPQTSVLSNINISYDPQKYIQNIKALMNDYNNLEQLPTLINYMGYTDGIGINILSAAVIYTQPTDLVQINSKNPNKNFGIDLHSNIIKVNSKLLLPNNEVSVNYNYFNIQSMCNTNDGWTLEPRQMREMCILSYFGQMVNSISNSIFDVVTPIYQINLSDVNLTNLDAEIVSPAVVNGNLVALCSLKEENDCVFQCHGWGIVRGIDVALDKLVLLTPENLQTLNNVSHLVCNSVTLPPSIYMTSDGVIGKIPYVMSGELVSFGQITKRVHFSAKK